MKNNNKKRIEQLQNILNSQEPYRQWVCKEHNTLGDMNRICCEEELKKLLGIKSCPTCKN